MPAHVSWVLCEGPCSVKQRRTAGSRSLAGAGDLTSLCLSFPICQVGATLIEQPRGLGRILGLVPKVPTTHQHAARVREVRATLGDRWPQSPCRHVVPTATLYGRFCWAHFMTYFSSIMKLSPGEIK